MSPLRRSRGAECLSDLLLDRLVAGEIADPAEAQTHLASCPRCAERKAELDRVRAEVSERPVPRALARAFAGKPRRRLRPWQPALAAGLAAAAATVILLRPAPAPPPPRSPEYTGTRAKGGGAHFQLYVRHGDTTRAALSGEVVAPGDTLQLSCSSPEPGFVAVLSRDGAGTVSVYVPGEPDARALVPIAAGHDVPLPASTVLDATLGQETLYALFCPERLALAPLVDELRRTGTLDAPTGCRLEPIRLDKRP
jgi:hypothetical protein